VPDDVKEPARKTLPTPKPVKTPEKEPAYVE
jgi:hypothetical protein